MRSRYINRYARDIVKKLRAGLSEDFAKNKALVAQMDPNLTKKQVNELSGYVTRMMKKGEAE